VHVASNLSFYCQKWSFQGHRQSHWLQKW